jgi:hypothetical protein
MLFNDFAASVSFEVVECGSWFGARPPHTSKPFSAPAFEYSRACRRTALGSPFSDFKPILLGMA